MTELPPSSAIDSAIAELIHLFAGPLSGVRFPDVDHATLAQLAEAVEQSTGEVEQARALLAAAEASLEARRAELAARAQRAKSYARVYAEGDAALQAELDRIQVPKPGARSGASVSSGAEIEPKRRGRPRKVRDASSLFTEPVLVEAPAAE